MSDAKKIEIAKDYVGLHKISNADEWQPMGIFGDEKYLAIYNNLDSGEYGNVRDNDDEREIEISSSDSNSGNPVIFNFDAIAD